MWPRSFGLCHPNLIRFIAIFIAHTHTHRHIQMQLAFSHRSRVAANNMQNRQVYDAHANNTQPPALVLSQCVGDRALREVYFRKSVADLEAGRAGSASLPLGD